MHPLLFPVNFVDQGLRTLGTLQLPLPLLSLSYLGTAHG